MNTRRIPSSALVLAAYLTVYLAWGSTYLGIRIAIETLPPFLMAGARFAAAGAILLGLLRLFSKLPHAPTAAQWRNASVTGALLLLIGNGGVTWVELQGMPSSIAALLVAVVPAWIVLLEWLRGGGPRPGAWIVGGLILGFLGVGLLVWPRAESLNATSPPHAAVDPWGAALLMGACVSWAVGSLLARRAKPDAADASAVAFSPLLPVGLQMLCGGALLVLLGVLCGEIPRVRPSQMSAASVGAFFYLLTFGSLLGFSAYSWLLQVSSPARVSTYAYVNPIIAVLLGWLLGGERLDGRTFFAAGIIVAGVALVILGQQQTPSPAAVAASSASSRE